MQQTAQSITNIHLSFMLFLLHVSASNLPSSGRLYTQLYRYSKFCRRYASVESKHNICATKICCIYIALYTASLMMAV